MIKINTFSYEDRDDLCANSYVLSDENKNAVVFDPSVDYNGIVDFLKSNKLKLKGIILTHAHFDHMRGVNILSSTFNVPTYVQVDDLAGTTDYRYNLSMKVKPVIITGEVKTICDNDVLELLKERIKVIHTPYHTEGSSCFYLKDSKILISGDTLFQGSVGRCDFNNSTPGRKDESFEKLLALPDDVKVYPGHGPSTSIGNERKCNPFLKR